jgi:hypothetical protein
LLGGVHGNAILTKYDFADLAVIHHRYGKKKDTSMQYGGCAILSDLDTFASLSSAGAGGVLKAGAK